jgi:hypothetical protein
MKPNRLLAIIAALAMTLTVSTAVLADHTIDLGASGTDQSGLCTGDYFKIEDAGVLEEGTHTYTGTTKDGVPFTAVLTVVLDASNDVESITVVSTDPDYVLIVVKAGTQFFSSSGPTITGGGKAISDVAFCLTTETTTTTTEETTTEETTTEETTTEETTTEETTTEETTTEETTTEETTSEETTSEETTSSASVEELTPPSTDTIGQPTSSSSVSTGLLLVLAGILSGILVLVPAAARRRR